MVRNVASKRLVKRRLRFRAVSHKIREFSTLCPSASLLQEFDSLQMSEGYDNNMLAPFLIESMARKEKLRLEKKRIREEEKKGLKLTLVKSLTRSESASGGPPSPSLVGFKALERKVSNVARARSTEEDSSNYSSKSSISPSLIGSFPLNQTNSSLTTVTSSLTSSLKSPRSAKTFSALQKARVTAEWPSNDFIASEEARISELIKTSFTDYLTRGRLKMEGQRYKNQTDQSGSGGQWFSYSSGSLNW